MTARELRALATCRVFASEGGLKARGLARLALRYRREIDRTATWPCMLKHPCEAPLMAVRYWCPPCRARRIREREEGRGCG